MGRRVSGGENEAISPAEIDAIAAEAFGGPATMVAKSHLGRDLGRTLIDKATKRPVGVSLSRELEGQHFKNVYAHEIGHVVDQLAGEIKATRCDVDHTGGHGSDRCDVFYPQLAAVTSS